MESPGGPPRLHVHIRPSWRRPTPASPRVLPRSRRRGAMARLAPLLVSLSGRLRSVAPAARKYSAAATSRSSRALLERDGAGGRLLTPGVVAPRGRLRAPQVPTGCRVPRAALGQRRRNGAGHRSLSDRYLADRRVTPRTADNYNPTFVAFSTWAASHKLSTRSDNLDRTLRKY